MRQRPGGDRRRLISRHRTSPQRRRLTYGIIGISLLLIAGILIAGYVVIFVMPPKQMVVQVNDVVYTRGDMVQMLRIRQRSTEYLGGSFNAGADVFESFHSIVENEIIAQAAPKLGITATQEEVDAHIRELLTSSDTSGKSEAQVEREFRERYASYLNTIQVSEAEHRELIRRSILREKMRQYVGESVPLVAEQAHVYRLTMPARGEIDIMMTKYRDYVGVSDDPEVYAEAFKRVTREFSVGNPEVIRKGGDLGWMPKGILEDYDDIIFSLEPGELSDPIRNMDPAQQGGSSEVFIFMVSEKEDAREISPQHRDTLKTRALQDWLNERRTEYAVQSQFNSDVYAWVVDQLRISSSTTPTPQPNDPFQQLLGN